MDLFRREFYEDRTIGELFANFNFFCYVLEDKVRPVGETKVFGQTAIPFGNNYKVILDMSTRFKRVTPHILNVPGFDGVRFHGGNRPENTEGCPLVAKNKTSENGKIIVYDSAEAELTRLLEKYNGAILNIVDGRK